MGNFLRRNSGDIFALKPYFTAIRFVHAGQHMKTSGLPSAVWPHDTVDLAFLKRQRDVFQNNPVAKAFDMFNFSPVLLSTVRRWSLDELLLNADRAAATKAKTKQKRDVSPADDNANDDDDDDDVVAVHSLIMANRFEPKSVYWVSRPFEIYRPVRTP